MSGFHIRPASTASDDGLWFLQNYDTHLPWLASIGSGAQFGISPLSEDQDNRAMYRQMVGRSDKGWNAPFSRDWIRAYIAEVDIPKHEVPSELLGRASTGPADTVRLPVAGMVLRGRSKSYVRSILPEQDDSEPFVYLEYLLSDRRTNSLIKGAGTALIAHSQQEAKNLGVSRICSDCWQGNDQRLVR